MSWTLYELETSPPTIHVVPDDDLIAHEISDDCPCGPDQVPVTHKKLVGWRVDHASLDGREAGERERRLH